MKILVSSFVMPDGPGAAKAGVGRHILATLDGIARTDLGHTYDVFLPDRFPIPPEWRDSPWTTWHPVPVPNVRARLLWEHARVASEARRRSADVLFATFPAVPFRSRVPMVSVIHDAFPRTHPQWYGPKKRLILDGLHAHTAKRCKRIVTVSEWSKGEIARAYHVPEERIVVAYNGPGNELAPLTPAALARVDLSGIVPEGTRYLMTLSTLEPRKNLSGLLEAFAQLRPRHAGLKLLVVGARGWKESPVFETVARLGIEEDVIFAGYVEDALIGPLLQCAELFVLPSFVEGFGIPVLEAMTVGAPVACSDTSSLPEVAGDAAFFFPPGDPPAIAGVIGRALADPEARMVKAREGLSRSGAFSWGRSLRAIEKAWIGAVS